MKKFIENLKRDIAVTFDGADVRAVKFAASMLKSHGFIEIPPEYTEFLKITDGLIWNGLELYGTKAYERGDKGYSFPGIIDINMDFMGFEALFNKIVVGRAAEELIVYSSTEKRWQCADRTDFTVTQVAPSFSELIYSFIEGLF